MAHELNGLTIVKLGGRSVESAEGRLTLAKRLRALRERTRLIVVHGGGAQVSAALKAAGIEPRFVAGLRVTDEKVLEVAEPIFTQIGKVLAHTLTVAGAPAVALTGRDAALLEGVVKDPALGRVGTVTRVDAELLRHLVFNGITPVVGPIAVDAHGALNVNADEVASAIAKAVGAKDLLLLTDVPAVKNELGRPIPVLTPDDARELIKSGVASGGMIPKIHGALEAVHSGVARVRVLDDSGLSELAEGRPAGTLFVEAR
ncbi:MAG TPA: acetylglutamate kinase [Candidatus Thermoplasmatota archaeon]|nr:acetylglutamate kinase [Candidatus Thermoplasmatota archaeon]